MNHLQPASGTVPDPSYAEYTDVDLLEKFAGPGGFSEGARMIGIRDTDMVGVELADDPVATARAAGHRRIHASVCDIVPALFLETSKSLTAPPCPTYTVAGKGSGRNDMPIVLKAIEAMMGWGGGKTWREIAAQVADPRTALVLETLRFAIEMPGIKVLVAEQVPAVAPIWLEMGYELVDSGLFRRVDLITVRADDVGTTTRRRRCFLIATKEDHEPDFTGLPMRSWHCFGKHIVAHDPEPITPIAFPRTSMAQALGWPTGLRINTRGNRRPGGGNEFSADGPAQSLTGNGARSWYRTDLGPVTGRLTAAQAGLLQGFPADYPWQGRRTSQFQQVADTVSPLVAAAVIGSATGIPWHDAIHQRIEELYGHPRPGQVAFDLTA